MADFNWCHGPNCHTHGTLSRIRGSKGNKVLRTIKIKQGRYSWGNDNSTNHWDYFCNQSCLMDYIRTHITSVIAIAPRREALETPIKDPERTENINSYGYSWSRWNIEKKG